MKETKNEHRPWWTRPHQNWRFWVIVLLMLTAMLVYVMSDDLALRPRNRPQQSQSGISHGNSAGARHSDRGK